MPWPARYVTGAAGRGAGRDEFGVGAQPGHGPGNRALHRAGRDTEARGDLRLAPVFVVAQQHNGLHPVREPANGHGAHEERLALTPDAVAWRGGAVEPAALRPGDQVVARLHRTARDVADRIWASIGRVAGTIVERTEQGLPVDEGSTRKRQFVIIPARAAGRIGADQPAHPALPLSREI